MTGLPGRACYFDLGMGTRDKTITKSIDARFLVPVTPLCVLRVAPSSMRIMFREEVVRI